MVDVITTVVICHINLFCHHRRTTNRYNPDNAVVCKYLKEVDDQPLPEWCYLPSTAQQPRKRNEF